LMRLPPKSTAKVFIWLRQHTYRSATPTSPLTS